MIRRDLLSQPFEDAVALYVVFKRAVAKLSSMRHMLPFETKVHLSLTETYILGQRVLLGNWGKEYGQLAEDDFDRIAEESGLPIQSKVDEVVSKFLRGDSITGSVFSSTRTN